MMSTPSSPRWNCHRVIQVSACVCEFAENQLTTDCLDDTGRRTRQKGATRAECQIGTCVQCFARNLHEILRKSHCLQTLLALLFRTCEKYASIFTCVRACVRVCVCVPYWLFLPWQKVNKSAECWNFCARTTTTTTRRRLLHNCFLPLSVFFCFELFDTDFGWFI